MKKINNTQEINNNYSFKIFRPIIAILGIVFLSNPVVGLVDILPDFVGYFLLVLALDGIKRLNGDIEYGVKKLKYLCAVSMGFFVLMFYTFKMDSSWVLTLTFSYMAISVILGLTATNDVFGGLDYCTDRHGSEGFPSVFEPKLMTKIYIVTKSVLVVIPELYALIEVESRGELSLDKDYATILSTEKYAIAVCLLLSAGIGIAWLKYVISYCNAFKNDKVLNEKLLKLYLNDYSKNGFPIDFFSVNFGNGLILVSHIFIYDFVLDSVHFLPEFLSVLLSSIGLFIVRRYVDVRKLWKYAIPSFLIQVAVFAYRHFFAKGLLDILDITTTHLIVSSVLAVLYIVSTFVCFSHIHEITSASYEEMFGKKLIEIYEWGDIFYFIAIICSGANIVCPVWRPYFVAVMLVSLFVSIYHYSKIYTNFNSEK